MPEGAIRSISINKGIKSEDIIKLWDKQYILSQIARILNCSVTNIRNRLIALGIYDKKEVRRRRKGFMSKKFSGEGNPMYGKPGTQLGKKFTEGHREKICRALKGKHTSPKTEFKEGHKGLSRDKHPNWQGGKSFEPYTPEFNKRLKEEIREKDNYLCQLCGKTQEQQLKEIGFSLNVHHIDYDKTNNRRENLISLCNSCNVLVNKDRTHWIEHFREMRENYD